MDMATSLVEAYDYDTHHTVIEEWTGNHLDGFLWFSSDGFLARFGAVALARQWAEKKLAIFEEATYHPAPWPFCLFNTAFTMQSRVMRVVRGCSPYG